MFPKEASLRRLVTAAGVTVLSLLKTLQLAILEVCLQLSSRPKAHQISVIPSERDTLKMGVPNEGLLTATPAPGPSLHRRQRIFALLALLLFLSYAAFSGLRTRCHTPSSAELDRWIRKQERVSYSKILSNIGPPAGAAEGLVIASPSRGEVNQPDYFVSCLAL